MYSLIAPQIKHKKLTEGHSWKFDVRNESKQADKSLYPGARMLGVLQGLAANICNIYFSHFKDPGNSLR